MLTKTITIIGELEEFSTALLKILAEQDLQLLFVSTDQEKNVKLQKQFEQFKTVAEVEFRSSEKEGCWEADVIILYKPSMISTAIIERIKGVATQKTVLVIDNIQENKGNFKELLPHSKVIEVELTALQEICLTTYLGIRKSEFPETTGY